jgi:hypothetical protein
VELEVGLRILTGREVGFRGEKAGIEEGRR